MRTLLLLGAGYLAGSLTLQGAGSVPLVASRAMVVSQEARASEVGLAVMKEGGNAVDAAVATAFALAVTHPAAGNLGGGGFLVYRPKLGKPVAYDFREVAPGRLESEPWLVAGGYDPGRHHDGHGAVGVPGSVAGLYLAWQEQGGVPWAGFLQIGMAHDRTPVTQ